MKINILVLLVLVSLLSGCAGPGFNKKATLMPDNVKLEMDFDPQDNFNSKEATVGCSWNLK